MLQNHEWSNLELSNTLSNERLMDIEVAKSYFGILQPDDLGFPWNLYFMSACNQPMPAKDTVYYPRTYSSDTITLYPLNLH